MARVTTHVLDTSRGVPGAGMVVELFAVGAERRLLGAAVTDADGRAVPGAEMAAEIGTGVYELVFHAGTYFRSRGVELPNPPFIDEVTVRFGIAEATGRYHVPLLLSPWSYATYRGS